MTTRRALLALALVTFWTAAAFDRGSAAAPDVVLYTSDATTLKGNWAKASTSTAAGGQYLSSADAGWSTANTPIASPAHYFEATFTAAAATPYRVWLRLRGTSNSKWNESVWVQFSDSTNQSGSAIYRIGTGSALLVNLATDASAGSLNGWGWQGGAYWLAQATTVKFASSGSHTIRVQTREDGVQIDQIVLSPSTYLSTSPGDVTSDSTIVPKGTTSSPFTGTPAAVPGTIQAEDFDNGGEGMAYHDSGSGNAGGAYRQTGVDLEASTEGGYNVGWIAPGEWLKYTVNVAAAGTYTATFRVASYGQGGTFHLEMNGANVTGGLTVPNTGGWQKWTTLSRTVTLSAGQQSARLVFDTAGSSGAIGNVNWIKFASASAPPPPPPPPTGTEISVLSWNIRINDFTDSHARTAMAKAVAVSPRPQVIAVQEAWVQFYPSYLDELKKRTGQTWYGVFYAGCPPGGWNGTTCTKWHDQGNAIFSTFPIVSSGMIYLPYPDCWTSARNVIRAAISVAGRTVQVFNTHLQTGGCTNAAQARYNSMSLLKSWAKNYSKPQIVAGDFNADPDQIASSQGMSPDFVESFQVAGTGSRFTYPVPSPSMKLDYWFFDAGFGAQPLSSVVPTSTGSVSDHYPVRTTFLIH
jgi:endonuclease/exonuclease/phosphatase family metal-dependent hydrolase